MSGLEFLFRKTLSEASELPNSKGPCDFEGAVSDLISHCESQLPTVVETDFIPISFDISHDGLSAIVGGRHGNVGLFDLETKRLMRDEEVSKSAILQIAFAANDTQIVILNQACELLFVDYGSYAIAHKIELKPGPTTIKVRPEADLLYFNQGSEIRVVRIDTNEEIDERKYTERGISMQAGVTCLDISDDGSLIAVGLSNGSLKLIHGNSETELQSTASFEASPTITRFSEHRRHLAAGFEDFVLRVWNVDSSLSLKYELSHHTDVITGIAFARDNRYMVSGSKDSNIVMWDLKVERLPYTMNLIDSEILWFKSSHDHKKLYISQNLLNLVIWEVPQLNKNARYRKHTGPVNKLCFIPGTFDVLSISDDGHAVIWDYRNDLIQEILQFQGELTNLVMSESGQFVIIVSSKPCLYTLSLSSFKYEEAEMPSKVLALRLSSDEIFLAITDEFNRVLIYEVETMERRCIVKGHQRPVIEVYFLAENKTILTASLDGSLGKFEIETNTRVSTFEGHKSPVVCMIVTQEGWVISASEDCNIIIWNIDAVMLYSISAKENGRIYGLFLSSDNMHMIVLQENLISYWQMYNLSVMFEINTQLPSRCIALSRDEKIIAVGEGSTVFIEENPLKSKTPRFVGKRLGSIHKYMKFIVDTLKNNLKTTFDPLHNHWVYIPYLVGASHLLSYNNRLDDLSNALFFDENSASFFSTINNENPLSICVDLAYKNCIDICLKYIKSDYKRNPRAYVPIESCLTKLNTVDIPGITRLYDTIFQKSTSEHLPVFALHETKLPALYHAEQLVIFPENIVQKDFFASNGRSIVFYQSLCPLDLDTGTTGSIEFLESLTECPSDQIFRSTILQVLLNNKWDRVKWAVYGQGLIYILYMILLSFYCILFIDNKAFLILLFIVHALLFFYEVTQIATDFFDYWLDLYNILDQLRGLSFTVYAVLAWRGDNNMDVLLTVIIFSWTRGISYFRMFDGTRYMVRLLSEVIKDMREFFVVLFYSTIAFSFVLYLRNPSLSFSAYLTVSYRMDLGDFDADYTTAFDWIVFFLATMLNLTIMLNLLISIMGDTYAKVQESNDIANYQELTEMIIEIEKLMFWKKRLAHKHYLQQCDFLTREESNNDKILEKIRNLKVQIGGMEKDMNFIKEKVKDNSILEMEGSVLEMKNDQQTLKNEVREALERSSNLLSRVTKKLNIPLE